MLPRQQTTSTIKAAVTDARAQIAGVGRPAVILFTADWEVEERATEMHALGATTVSKLTDLEEVMRAIASLCAAQRLDETPDPVGPD